MDNCGNKIEHIELSCEDIKIGLERELDTKAIKFPARRRRILIDAQVPSLGYKTYALRLRGPNYVKHPEIGPDRLLIARDCGVLENEHLKLTMNSNGTFSLLHKETGRLMNNMHYFTDSGEFGSAHISNKPQRNSIITSHGCAAKIAMIESNNLRGTFKFEQRNHVVGIEDSAAGVCSIRLAGFSAIGVAGGNIFQAVRWGFATITAERLKTCGMY